MYARVAHWEGGEGEAMRASASEITSRAESGPPEGVDSVGFTLLIDPDNGRAMAIALFETKEALEQGDKVLNEMNPPEGGMGRRASVDVYEVSLDVRA